MAKRVMQVRVFPVAKKRKRKGPGATEKRQCDTITTDYFEVVEILNNGERKPFRQIGSLDRAIQTAKDRTRKLGVRAHSV